VDWEVPPAPTKEQELEGLRQEAEWLKGQLDAISQRIEEIEE
jgi:prefoldin subunit 5